ncbi:MAG: flavodoxin-dependent (E)-4-hydroxy-3-methylbut-2-enyl-diphosphate synthase [Hydrogenobaculum sp.]|nr:MAG: 4-hydroxy-3-methylbut-2-en-1-yl diphosphate synthase [Hydrogenobaculum sp.]
MIKRRKTREITLGNLKIGGNNPIVVQSMTSTKTHDIESTISQIERLIKAGCEAIRVAVPAKEDAEALKEIVKYSEVPIIADIHFVPYMAFLSMEAGAHGIRINPGNINKKEIVRDIVLEAKRRNICVRLGVNSGSLEKHLLEKYGYPSAEALAESALNWSEFFESLGFYNFKVSIKGSDVVQNAVANEIFAEKTDIPLHIGITEAGMGTQGMVKSSVGLGILLYKGIGDTIRVSLTDEPEKEVEVAYEILKSLGLKKKGIDIVSCPTCGRIEVNLPKVVKQVQEALKDKDLSIKVAIMGCAVNAIGEASHADVGLACMKGGALLFKDGKILKKVTEENMVSELLETIEKYYQEV